MNKGVIAFIGFAAGGTAGFFAGKALLEQHYNQVVQEEIDSVKAAFRQQAKEMAEANKPKDIEVVVDTNALVGQTAAQIEEEKLASANTSEVAKKMGINESTIRSLRNDAENKKKDYRSYCPNKKPEPVKKEKPKEEKKTSPYIIPPEEFGTNAGYEEISLTYYSDGIVADDDDNIMSDEDIHETVGHDSLKHFGEYERDSVFVRNDDMRADYEILQDERKYEDATDNDTYEEPNQ